MPRMTNDRLLWETAMGNKKMIESLAKQIAALNQKIEQLQMPKKRGRPPEAERKARNAANEGV